MSIRYNIVDCSLLQVLIKWALGHGPYSENTKSYEITCLLHPLLLTARIRMNLRRAFSRPHSACATFPHMMSRLYTHVYNWYHYCPHGVTIGHHPLHNISRDTYFVALEAFSSS